MRQPLPATALTLALVAAMIAGCGASTYNTRTVSSAPRTQPPRGAPAPGGTQVRMDGIRFRPATITVKVGRAVHWTNADPVAHNVVALSGAKFRSNDLNPGRGFTFTPSSPGRVTYYCTIHGRPMSGTIVVRR